MDIVERLPQVIRGRIGWIVAALAVLIVVAIIIARRSGESDVAAQSASLTVTTTSLRNVALARGITANGSIW